MNRRIQLPIHVPQIQAPDLFSIRINLMNKLRIIFGKESFYHRPLNQEQKRHLLCPFLKGNVLGLQLAEKSNNPSGSF
jgi:hypothetical protein